MRKRHQNVRLTNPAVMGLLVSTFMAVIVTTAQTPKIPLPQEQSHFELEQDLAAPVALPDNVLEMLRRDPIVLASRCVEPGQPSEQISASFFEASRLHLHSSHQADLIVKPKNPCLSGANIGPFWIFRHISDRYKLILSVSALGLEILNSRSHGYRDLLAGAVIAGKVVNVTYKFDGNTYQEFKAKAAEIH